MSGIDVNVHCSNCGKCCSGVDLEGRLIVRAWVECPECMEQSEGNSWRQIATAPKDGTHVVLFGTLWNDPDQRPRACVSWYCTRRDDSPAHALGWFFSAPGYTNGFNPTHWMPKPDA